MSISTLHTDDSPTFAKHYDNIMSVLARRIEAAQAANNAQLIELLEQEKQQIAQTATPHRDVPLAVRFDAFKQGLLKVLFGGSGLQASRYQQGSDGWWYAFDPQTGDAVYADSEAELRLWIKENYLGR